MGTNLDLFPTRISGRTVKAKAVDSRGKSMAGGYSATNDTAVIPLADTAFARTVRLHESAHAIWSRESGLAPGDFVGQAIEDARIHTLLNTEGDVRRDEVATALQDLKTLSPAKLAMRQDRAIQAVQLLRAASILRKPDSSAIGQSRLEKVAAKYHEQGVELINSILAEMDAGNVDQARALTSLLIRDESAEQSNAANENSDEGESQDSEDEDESNGEAGSNMPTKPKPSKDSKPPSKPEPGESKPEPSEDKPDGEAESDGDDEMEGESKPESKPGKIKTNGKPKTKPTPEKPKLKEKPIPDELTARNESDYVPAATKAGEKIVRLEAERKDSEDGNITAISGDTGEKLRDNNSVGVQVPYPVMYVHTLSPNASRRVRGKGHNALRSASQGLRIRCNRLALNAANPCGGSRLFETKHLGGTVLIDASGSMSLSDTQLYMIAEKFPAGKIAYYSGKCDGWNREYMKDANGEYKNDARGYRIAVPTMKSSMEHLEAWWTGDLVIYANNGRIRKDRGSKLPKRHDCNLVDYQAILWLLKQPAPRYLMTDIEFTGPLATRARTLLQASEEAKKIIHFYSMEQLIAEVKKLKR